MTNGDASSDGGIRGSDVIVKILTLGSCSCSSSSRPSVDGVGCGGDE